MSNRKYQVVRLLGSGKNLSDIAEDLSLSPKAISTCRT
ncbi:MAG: hypothetical protein PHT15_00810 [Gallionellaceae bacterium]|nr:hypothetical protein [Gallionellaceae bacterium]